MLVENKHAVAAGAVTTGKSSAGTVEDPAAKALNRLGDILDKPKKKARKVGFPSFAFELYTFVLLSVSGAQVLGPLGESGLERSGRIHRSTSGPLELFEGTQG